MYKLIADCGSTKCDWALVPTLSGGESDARDWGVIATSGFNAAVTPEETIAEILSGELMPQLRAKEIAEVHFYGAGCIGGETDRRLAALLGRFVPGARVEVASDMLGAARALLGDKPGIACILGTGSNSALYNGSEFIANTPPLGYILGDEGSGASLGKRLVNALFKGLLPDEIVARFHDRYSYTKADIIENVYRRPGANRFLASFCPFLCENLGDAAIHDLVKREFALFVSNNLVPYTRCGAVHGARHCASPAGDVQADDPASSILELPIGFVGSVAHYFREPLTEVLSEAGFSSPLIVKSPIDLLAAYHRKR